CAGRAFRYGPLVAEIIVQRLSPGLAAGKQTSRILSRNRSEPYSRQTARVPAIKSARILLRCVRSRLALNGRSETSAVCPLSRQSGLGLRHRDAPRSVTKPTENARSAEPVLSRRPERVHAREMKPPCWASHERASEFRPHLVQLHCFFYFATFLVGFSRIEI